MSSSLAMMSVMSSFLPGVCVDMGQKCPLLWDWKKMEKETQKIILQVTDCDCASSHKGWFVKWEFVVSRANHLLSWAQSHSCQQDRTHAVSYSSFVKMSRCRQLGKSEENESDSPNTQTTHSWEIFSHTNVNCILPEILVKVLTLIITIGVVSFLTFYSLQFLGKYNFESNQKSQISSF